MSGRDIVGQQLLLVEDDPHVSRVVAALLEVHSRNRSTLCNHAEEAWAILQEQPVDVVIADVGLPGDLDGLGLCRRMKDDERLRLVPVILMTGNHDVTSLSDAFDAGADDFIAKPIRREHLLARLRAAVRLRQLLVELAAKNAELGEAIDRLQHSQEELLHGRKMEAIGQLASGIAHELNTPIQYIGDNLRFLEESFADLQRMLSAESGVRLALSAGGDPTAALHSAVETAEDCDLDFLREEVPSAIAQGLEGVDRVRRIVVAMRDFAHPGSEAHEPVDLNQAIRSTAEVSRNTYKYAADLDLDLEDGLGGLIGDAGGIKQVILNLIVNAAQAIEDRQRSGDERRGRIAVASRSEGEEVLLSVADDGCGMDEEVRRRIFDPFFTTKEPGRGTGQGLAIINNVVINQHKGRIAVDSQPGVGTTFTIRFRRKGPGVCAPARDHHAVS